MADESDAVAASKRQREKEESSTAKRSKKQPTGGIRLPEDSPTMDMCPETKRTKIVLGSPEQVKPKGRRLKLTVEDSAAAPVKRRTRKAN